MKKILKILALIVFILILAVAGFLTYIVKFTPNIPIEDVKIEYTPERIERGKYLAHSVAGCVDCHSTRDWTKFTGPLTPGTEGKGGELFDEKLGYPGKYYASNLTPSHLKDWTDGEIFRAITGGVSRDGRPLFPVMPYPYFGKMDKEDIYSIISYIRTLQPINNEIPESKSNFPMNIIIHTIPSKPEFSAKPQTTDKVAYGKYLTTVATCIECHTQAKRGRIIEDLAFGGGRLFTMPNGLVASANITPDKETGIGGWDEELFIQRFKVFDKNQQKMNENVKEGEYNSVMPWKMYSELKREDLSAIYAYLKTVKPISNRVIKDKYLK
jgi:Cytochrome c